MIGREFDLYEQLWACRVAEARQRAGSEALWRGPRSTRRGRLARSGGRLMARLGQDLLALGQRLERQNLPQPSLKP